MPSQDIHTVKSGSAELLYAGDCGWSIDTAKAEKFLVKEGSPQLTILADDQTLRFPVRPLTVRMNDADPIKISEIESRRQVTFAVTDMGAISAKISFDLAGCTLPQIVRFSHQLEADTSGRIRKYGASLVNGLAQRIARYIEAPWESPAFETYRTFTIQELEKDGGVLELLNTHSTELAHILRGEKQGLAKEQIEDALKVAISYFSDERTIVDTRNAVFLGNASFKDISTVLGYTMIELLELKVLEAFLTAKLETDHSASVSIANAAKFPFRGRRFSLTELHKIEQEAALQLGRVSNPLDLYDDQYLADFRRLIATRLGLNEWAEQVRDKLEVVREISNNLNERTNHRRALAVETGVFLLVAYEVWHAVFKN